MLEDVALVPHPSAPGRMGTPRVSGLDCESLAVQHLPSIKSCEVEASAVTAGVGTRFLAHLSYRCLLMAVPQVKAGRLSRSVLNSPFSSRARRSWPRRRRSTPLGQRTLATSCFVEVHLVVEARRRAPRLERRRGLEESLAYAGHPVLGWHEDGRAGFDDRVEALGHGATRYRHLGDLREQVAFPVLLVCRRLRL